MAYMVVIFVLGILLILLSAIPYIIYLIRIRRVPNDSLVNQLTAYPNVSIVINAYCEGELVAERIRDICKTDYPKDNITLYVFNDGADKETGLAAKQALAECPFKNKLIEPEKRLGKAVCQNKAIELVEDEFIVFTDADITTEPNALCLLISKLCDESVGAVCADVRPVGSNSAVTGSESAYRSIYGKMCEYDSIIDSTYNFNGPLLAFRKSAVPKVNAMRGADDANLALECIKNGYQAKYVIDSIAYELQPKTRKAQFKQKIRRADGLVNSTTLFKSAGKDSLRPFWKKIFPVRKYMLLYSPLLLIAAIILLIFGTFLLNVPAGFVLMAIILLILFVAFLMPNNIISSFIINQIFLTIGLVRRKNIQQWNRIDK